SFASDGHGSRRDLPSFPTRRSSDLPEINLTPQLAGAVGARLESVLGADGLAVMHSGLSDGERVQAWARAQRGQARMLLGTRMAIFAPLSDLGLIVVDEEHDASYKQQDGLR